MTDVEPETPLWPDTPRGAEEEEATPAAASPAPSSSDSIDPQLALLESKLAEQEQLLREWRARDKAAEEGRSAVDILNEAKRRRDLARKAVQKQQARLTALQAAQQDKAKRLDKLTVKQASSKIVNPELALPSIALRGGGDDASVKEIQALMRENKELEEALARHDGTRLHLEKLQNDKRDMQRRIKELKNEEKLTNQQLEMKKAELAELNEKVKPSPVRARYEADVARLRKEISSHTVARTHAEREGTAHSKRLLRVRAVLASFLKGEGLKGQQTLPTADDELAARLAEHVIGLAAKVRTLERTVGVREEKAAALHNSSVQAAEELKRLVTRRGKEQRKGGTASALGLLAAERPGSPSNEALDRPPAELPAADTPEPLDRQQIKQRSLLRMAKRPGQKKREVGKGKARPMAQPPGPALPTWDADIQSIAPAPAAPPTAAPSAS